MSDRNAEQIFQSLSRMLDHYSEWFGRVMRKVFYPQDSGDISVDPPEELESVLADMEEHNIHRETTETLGRVTGELHRSADKMFESGQANAGNPDVKFMDEFINLHDEFVNLIRRLEKDKLLDGSGIDPLTGLRTEEAMFRDLQQELERKARRGKPFCIVLAIIDGFSEPEGGGQSAEDEKTLQIAADAIKTCIRTYDDAYYIGNGEYVLSLKHAALDGGMAAVDRLRRILRENGGGITMSYVTAEPGEGDDVQKLLEYLREDIRRYITEKDVSLQYYEISPLKRYVERDEMESEG